MKHRFLAWLLLAPAFPTATHAATIYVLPDGTGDQPTIAAALAAAVFGDTVLLGPGTFFEHGLPLKTGVDLVGETGDPAATVIDAGGLGRCVFANSLSMVSISGITFRNGVHAVRGGLAFILSGSAQFTDCVFRDGSAPLGGGAAILDKGTTMTDCRFENNEATATDGGGLWHFEAFLTDCEFIGNRAQRNGGGLYTEYGLNSPGYMSRCTFTSNTAGGDGGGAYSTRSASSFVDGTRFSECTFESNSATNGGALRIAELDCLWDNVFLRNSASAMGGAALFHALSTAATCDCQSFLRNVWADNVAPSGGAVALVGSSDLLELGSTFSGNEAVTGAHVWSAAGSGATVWNVILAFGKGGSAASGGFLTASCVDVFGNEGGDYTGPLAGQSGVSNNFSLDPLFCDPTRDDYTLRANSPCAPPGVTGCGQVGARAAVCSPTALERASWGRIKSRFR